MWRGVWATTRALFDHKSRNGKHIFRNFIPKFLGVSSEVGLKFRKIEVTRKFHFIPPLYSCSDLVSPSLEKLRALTIWMEFSVALSGQMELHFLALRKRDRLSCIIWSEVSEVSETRESGSGYILTRIMAAELPEVLDVSSDDLQNLSVFFFGEEDDFICFVAVAFTFRQQNQQSASTEVAQKQEVLSIDHET